MYAIFVFKFYMITHKYCMDISFKVTLFCSCFSREFIWPINYNKIIGINWQIKMPETNIVHKHPHSLIQGLAPLGCALALSVGLEKVKKVSPLCSFCYCSSQVKMDFGFQCFPSFMFPRFNVSKFISSCFKALWDLCVFNSTDSECHSFIYLKVITSTIRQDFKLRSPA